MTEQIVAKTDGNPLFVEELSKAVLEAGILVETAEGYRLNGPLPSLAIPATVHDSLMARLDRLAAEPIAAWAVEGVSDANSRFEAIRTARLTDLIGRENEIGFLVERQRLAWMGQGRIILISGAMGRCNLPRAP